MADKNTADHFADETFLRELRSQMLRFATLHLNERHAAEDAVQEALIGAMRNASSFAGKAAFRTWVFAILRNKIADILRHHQRVMPLSSLQQDDDDDLSTLFDEKGFWHRNERPKEWRDPAHLADDAGFWRVFQACLDHLPAQQARAFMMREFIELETPEICSSLGISVSNLNVLLHRARTRLRACLESNWFAPGEISC